MKSIRDKIWYFLIDSKTNEKLSGLIVKKYQKMELWSNIFLALATSSSVAAWAFWDKYPSLWILIIGISQVLLITKPYFLFPKYIKVFNEKSIHWQHMSVQLEQLWHELNEKYINDKDASKLYFELKQKSLTFDNVPDDLIFFRHTKLQEEAETECNIFINKV